MPLLDAVLAFALTMLVVATVVAALLRAVKFSASMRRKCLRQMLEEYFEKEVEPAVRAALTRVEAEVDKEVGKAITTAAAGLAKVSARADPGDAEQPVAAGDLIDRAGAQKLVEVGREEMVAWLKETELGRELAEKLKTRADVVFDELGARYEEIGARFTKIFENRARTWATVFALVIAVAFNIDSINLLRTYMTDDSARTAALAQMSAALERAERAQEAAKTQPGAEGATAEQVRAALRNAQFEIASLSTSKLPIGWPAYPYCPTVGSDRRCAQAAIRTGATGPAKKADATDSSKAARPFAPFEHIWSSWSNAITAFLWLLGVAITGLLAGLGTPFWYDVVTGIARFSHKVKQRQSPTAGARPPQVSRRAI